MTTPGARAVLIAAAAGAWYACFRGALIDDACIQLRYAETLVTSGTWGFYPGHTTSTATSPLNVALLGFARTVGGSPQTAAVAVSAASVTAVFVAARRAAAAAGLPAVLPWIAAVGVAANPLLCSTVGMEALPFAALLWTAFAMALERRPFAAGLVAGLLTLARPDGALLVPALAFALREERRAWLRIAGAWSLVVLPWVAFSWAALGSAVPDTFFLKRAQMWSGGSLTFANGAAAYLRVFPAAVLLSLTLIPFAARGVASGGPATRAVRAVTVFALVHFAAYVAMGVPPYHWYYAPAVVALALAGSVGLARSFAAGTAAGRGVAAAAGLALLAGAVVSLPRGAAGGPPIHTNWATFGEYSRIAAEIDARVAPGETVALDGEAGTLGLLCRARLLNEFSDPGSPILAWIVAAGRDGDGGAFGLVRRLNFARRPEPVRFDAPRWRLRQGGRGDVSADGAVLSWDTSSPWAPAGRIVLER